MISRPRWIFVVCFVASLVFIAVMLNRFGAREIREDGSELSFLLLIGAGWLLLASFLVSWFGFNIRDDAIERNNPAALIASCCALGAVALIYAGGSAGEGPSYANNFFSAGLGTAGLFLLWSLFEYIEKISVSIAEERDVASGARFGGFILATGLILGRAVAGDWHSEEQTFKDFLHGGWPAALLWGIGLIVEWLARPSSRRPFPRFFSCGLLPAGIYLALASAWVWYAGPWEGWGHGRA